MRRDDALLLDMAHAAADLALAVGGLNRAMFLTARVPQLAAQMALVMIGEAAGRLSQEFRDSHPEIDWPNIVAFRNVLVHEYHRVDLSRVHQIASVEAPMLATWLATVAPREPPPGSEG